MSESNKGETPRKKFVQLAVSEGSNGRAQSVVALRDDGIIFRCHWVDTGKLFSGEGHYEWRRLPEAPQND